MRRRHHAGEPRPGRGDSVPVGSGRARRACCSAAPRSLARPTRSRCRSMPRARRRSRSPSTTLMCVVEGAPSGSGAALAERGARRRGGLLHTAVGQQPAGGARRGRARPTNPPPRSAPSLAHGLGQNGDPPRRLPGGAIGPSRSSTRRAKAIRRPPDEGGGFETNSQPPIGGAHGPPVDDAIGGEIGRGERPSTLQDGLAQAPAELTAVDRVGPLGAPAPRASRRGRP